MTAYGSPTGLSVSGSSSGVIGTVVLSGTNITINQTISGNRQTIGLSAGAGGPGGGGVALSAGTQSVSTGTVAFVNSNGLTWGMSDSTQITAAFSTLSFANSNGISWGTNGSTITATVQTNYLTTAMASNRGSDFVAATAAFAGTSASGTINSTGISVSIGPYITTAALSNHSHGASAANGSFGFQTISFSNVNGISFGTSAGPAITASYTVPTVTNSSWTVSDTATSGTVARLAFTNLNGVTLSLSSGAGGSHTIVGSHNALTSQSNQQMTMFATGNTTLSSTGTTNVSSLIFRGSGAASVGVTNGSVLIDVAAGAAAITQSIGMSTQTAGGATAGTSGYATGDDILYHFVPGSNITMSQSINGASGTLSIYGPTAGGGATLSGYDGFANNELFAIAGGQATLWIDRLDLPCAMQFDRFGLRMTHSNATNSSGSATISVWVGLSSRNASTLSSVASTSFTTAITASGTAGSYTHYSGVKILPVPWTTTISPGNYWLGIVSRTTTGGANMSFGNLANSQLASTMGGYFGSATAATAGIRLAVGVYSATTAGMPTAVNITQVNGNSSAFLRQPAYLFMSNIF